MADKELEILLKTTADQTGAQQTSQALDQAAGSTQKTVAAHKEAGTAALGHAAAGRDLRKAMHAITEQVPLLGIALRALQTPIGAVLTGGIIAFQYLKKSLDDWNKAMDESAAKAAEHDFLPGIEARKAAMEEAATAAAKFAAEMAKAGTAEDDFTRALGESINKLHEMVAAQAEIESAQEAKELAELNLKEKFGGLSPVQGIAGRAAIKERYAKKRDELKTAAENAELAAKEEELKHDLAEQDHLEEDADRRRAAATAVKGRREQIAKDKESALKLQKDAQDAYEKAQAELDKFQQRNRSGVPTPWRNEFLDVSGEVIAGKNVQAAAERLQRINTLLITYDRREKGIKGYDLEVPAADAQKHRLENEERITKLQEEVIKLKEALKIRQGGRAIAGGFRSEAAGHEATGEMFGPGLGGTIIAGAAAAKVLDEGRKLTDQQALDYAAFVQLLRSINSFTQRNVKALEDVLGNNSAMAARITAIEEEVRRQAQWKRTNGLNAGG